MKKIKFHLIILSIVILAVSAFSQTVNFKGTVGEAKFQMMLVRSGNDLSGSYFYDKQGSANKLNLKGTVELDGNFTLKETDAAGKITGNFSGKWNEVENSAGVYLEGTWKSPAGKELGFYASQQNVYFTDGLSFATRKITENNKPKMYEVDAEYPEIVGGTNPNITKLNLVAKDVVVKSVANFKKSMQGFTAEDLKFAKERGISNYTEIGYDVEYADNNLVSIGFSEGVYTGGAHPNHFSYGLTYDLKNGKQLSLADLFKPNSNYLKVISDYSIASLKKELTEMSDEEWIKNGAGPDAENFKSWNLTEKGLVINFDPYQVAAYAAGPQMVVIPFDKLNSILKPDGAVSYLRK